MQKFKFKLESVLKMKTLLEEQCRNELGKIIVEKKKTEDEIARNNQHIDAMYAENESYLKNGQSAAHASLFPQLSAGYRARIEDLKRNVLEIEERIEAKKVELNEKRAELKLMTNLKEKELSVWKKAYNKHVDQAVEEMVMMWDESKLLEEEL